MSGSFFPLRKNGSSINPNQFPSLPPVNTGNNKNKDGSGRTQNLLPPLPAVPKVDNSRRLPEGFLVYRDRDGEQTPVKSETINVPHERLTSFDILVRGGLLGEHSGSLLVESKYNRKTRQNDTEYSIYYSPSYIVPLKTWANQIMTFQFGIRMIDVASEVEKLKLEAQVAYAEINEPLSFYRLSRYSSLAVFRDFLSGVQGLDLEYTKDELAKLASLKIGMPLLLNMVRDQVDYEEIKMFADTDLPDEWIKELLD